MGVTLVTGAAGFIGHSVCLPIAASGLRPVAVDSFDPYYESALKRDRAASLARAGVEVRDLDVADFSSLVNMAKREGVTRVVHLAAQAGVRHSISAPFAYQHANLAGHLSVLECCRALPDFEHLVYASSFSVYGSRPGHRCTARQGCPQAGHGRRLASTVTRFARSVLEPTQASPGKAGLPSRNLRWRGGHPTVYQAFFSVSLGSKIDRLSA